MECALVTNSQYVQLINDKSLADWKCNKCSSRSLALNRSNAASNGKKNNSSDISLAKLTNQLESLTIAIREQAEISANAMKQLAENMTALSIMVRITDADVKNIKGRQNDMDRTIIEMKEMIALKDAKMEKIEKEIRELKNDKCTSPKI